MTTHARHPVSNRTAYRIVRNRSGQHVYSANEARQIGAKFREVREARHLSGRDVAKLFNVSSSAIYLVETGQISMLDPYIERYVLLTGRERSEFLPDVWDAELELEAAPAAEPIAIEPAPVFQELLEQVMDEAETVISETYAPRVEDILANLQAYEEEVPVKPAPVTQPLPEPAQRDSTMWSLGWRLMKAFELLDRSTQQALVDLAESVVPKEPFLPDQEQNGNGRHEA